MTLTPG